MVSPKQFFLLTLFIELATASWNNLNCPAPRAPDNGLSFIFRNGELVHFRCHPGYYMIGKSVAYCVNNQWTEPTPECASIRGHRYPAPAALHDTARQTSHASKTPAPGTATDRNLFNWGERSEDSDGRRDQKTGVYGDGPRRLPLINGIWPPPSQQVMTLGPQSTPGPRTLVKEEIDIAELRHKQQEEVKRQRLSDDLAYVPQKKRRKGKKDRRNRKQKNDTISGFVDLNAPRETVISLGATEDGDALSVAFAKVDNSTEEGKVRKHSRHHYRHDGLKKRRRGKGKKWRNEEQYSSHIVARASRVDSSGVSPYYRSYRYQDKTPKISNEVAELRGRPIERIKKHNETGTDLFPLSDLDTTCMESLYGHNVPMIAPQLDHAFVYRYETRKNHDFPFNSYMQVKYRCLSGYHFADHSVRTLNCRQGKWVGTEPRCEKRENL